MSSKKKLADLKAQMNDMKKRMKGLAKTVFQEMSKELFEKHPILVSFSWKQYTPYFNDGDPCTFSAHTDEPDMVFLVDDEEVEVDGYDVPENFDYEPVTYKRIPKKLTGIAKQQRKAFDAAREFLQLFDDEDLEAMFGDHTHVTVSKNGVDTDEYSHD